MAVKRGLMIALCVIALGSEGVVLEWIGKSKVVNHHLDVPCHVLEKKWDHVGADSGNMVIKGDNLLALKALLPRYAGKVKCIYIDPPYNTGNEGWCYNDNVNDPTIRRWLNKVVGKEGEDFTRHDKWLCMMYPRLKLLQQLLSDDGVIFISIDFANESAHLRCVCDEIFGARNYIGELTWESVTQPDNAGLARFSLQQKVEPILCYIKDKRNYHGFLLRVSGAKKNYPHTGKFGACRFEVIEKSDAGDYKRDTMKFKILGQYPRAGKRWQIGVKTARELERLGKVEIVDGLVKRAVYPEDERDSFTPFWSHYTAKDVGTAETGKATLNEIFGAAVGFDTVKPVELVMELLSHVCSSNENAIVLDSFAGSGTTAHAVLNLNKADGGNRKFILVEMCDYVETITAERVKRVINGYGQGEDAVEGTGGAFSFYELGEPLMVGEELNEKVATERIREYIYCTEVNKPLPDLGAAAAKEPYLLGVEYDTAYYFCYEKGRVVTLDRALLKTIKTKADQYVVYADKCTLSEAELRRRHITFKKIPRDITRM